MRTARIVVGTDCSSESTEALHWAISEARLRGAAVHVVHAWCAYPPIHHGCPVTADAWDGPQATAARKVQDFVAGVAGHVRDVQITCEAVHAGGTAAQALVNAAADAELLVVASRGRGALEGLLLGSVSRECLQHAPCPVVVVPGNGVHADTPQPGDVATVA